MREWQVEWSGVTEESEIWVFTTALFSVSMEAQPIGGATAQPIGVQRGCYKYNRTTASKSNVYSNFNDPT